MIPISKCHHQEQSQAFFSDFHLADHRQLAEGPGFCAGTPSLNCKFCSVSSGLTKYRLQIDHSQETIVTSFIIDQCAFVQLSDIRLLRQRACYSTQKVLLVCFHFVRLPLTQADYFIDGASQVVRPFVSPFQCDTQICFLFFCKNIQNSTSDWSGHKLLIHCSYCLSETSFLSGPRGLEPVSALILLEIQKA